MDPPASHEPVLRQAVVELLCVKGQKILLDCTVGLGGHAEALLGVADADARLIGIDVDESNLRISKRTLERFSPRVRLFRANFTEIPAVLAQADAPSADVLLADLGFASSQMDDPARGLSFSADGPLDMRLDTRSERTAADLVNTLGEKELADLIYANGEERYSRRIARAIVTARKAGRIERTGELARVVSGAYPAPARRSRRGVHPATRTFQALRIAVNDELGSLDRLLSLLPDVLTPGGRAGIISFHSLEDRRVKQAFAAWAAGGQATILTRKPVTATDEEMQRNPRSRSAKLRVIERTS